MASVVGPRALLSLAGYLLLLGLVMPGSSPPSDNQLWGTGLLMWFLTVAGLLACAWTWQGPRGERHTVAIIVTVVLVLAGWRTSALLDDVWLDACNYAGSGVRCIDGDGTAPGWTHAVWIAVGPLAALRCVTIGRLMRRPLPQLAAVSSA